MKWNYAVITKKFNYDTHTGGNHFDVGRILAIRFDKYIHADTKALMLDSWVAYKMELEVPAEFFTVVEGKAEAEKFAKNLK